MIVRLSERDKKIANAMSMMRAYDIIKRPIVTEKLSNYIEQNFVYFEVDMKANKYEITKACEMIFELKVASVNTLIKKYGKSKFKNQEYVKPSTKKAMIKFVEKVELEKIVKGMQ